MQEINLLRLNICQICLKDDNVLQSMCEEELHLYSKLINKDSETELNICFICKYVLRKVKNFIKQCEYAAAVLQNSSDHKYWDVFNSPRMKTFHDLTTSETSVICLPIDGLVDDSIVADDAEGDKKFIDEDDMPLVLLSNCDIKADIVDNITEDSEIKYEDNVSLNEINTVVFDEEVDVDFDSKISIEYKHRSKRNGYDDVAECKKQRSNRKYKMEPDNFTSRMIRETDEYIVIKLSKDEVLAEMKNNLNSQRYLQAPFKCDKCVKGFNFDEVLRSHMEKHSQKIGPYKCEMCAQYCPSSISLRGHIKSHTTKYKCRICDLVRNSRQHILEHYSLVHTDTTADYTCARCEFTTKKRTVMQRHVKSHINNEKYSCSQCGKAFRTREILRVHVSRHDQSNRHKCAHCTRTFIYKSSLNKHVQCVHVHKEFYCVECDVTFTSMEALKQHLSKTKRHSDPSQFKFECAQCKERFITKNKLGTHQVTAHNMPKTAKCEHCQRTYSSTEALRLHVRRAHMMKKDKVVKIPCTICDKTFARKNVLKVHMRVHTGERPYVCPCGAAFTQLASLRAHDAAKHRK